MKKQILIFIFLVINNILCAQVLDTVRLECMYKLKYIKDKLRPDRVGTDEMLLLSGNKYSTFYSYRNYLIDSLQNANPIEYTPQVIDQMVIPAKIPSRRSENPERFLIDKVSEDLIVFGKIGISYYQYQEKIQAPLWQISRKDTCTILGYKCQKAVTNYHGRDWTVWFAPLISIGEGPWKLRGLPGLILKAEDADKHYVFECIGFEKPKIPKLINKGDTSGKYRIISKSEYFRESERCFADFAAYIGAIPEDKSIHRIRKINPIELDK
jgi:GLPGLI family protein